MAIICPFKAIRPAPDLACKIAALPYDVYNSSEARAVVGENPFSFLKIDRAETMFPEGTDMYSKEVYERAAAELSEMRKNGQFIQDEEACLYIYELTMNGRSQRGLVCCTSMDDYLNDVIKKHENTRADKELDRIKHVDACSAHTGPIFMAYRQNESVRKVLDVIVKDKPIYDFVSDDGIGHKVWKIAGKEAIEEIVTAFAQMASLYIADGHHRAASAVKAGLKRRNENQNHTGEEEYNYFLSVLFDERELQILDYNRVVHKVETELMAELLTKLEASFEIKECGTSPVRPGCKGEMGMYFEKNWYYLKARQGTKSTDAVNSLDVATLQNYVFAPIFGIHDFKTDSRLQFVGGIRGLEELVKIVDREKNAVAFAMYPTSMSELLTVADEGRLMPPKSTWFEPKLRSGLFIHEF